MIKTELWTTESSFPLVWVPPSGARVLGISSYFSLEQNPQPGMIKGQNLLNYQESIGEQSPGMF